MCDNKKFLWYPEDKFNNQPLFRKWVVTSSSKKCLEQWPHSRWWGKWSLSWSKWYKLQFFFVNSLQDSLGWSSLKQVQKHKRMSKRWTKAVNFISSLSPIHYVLFHSKATFVFFFYWRVVSSLLVKFALSAHFQSILYSNQWQIYLKLIIFSDNFTIVQACRWWQCIQDILCV